MRRIPLLLPVLLLAQLLLTGCVASRFTDNEPFDAKVIEAFIPGTTTAAEVTDSLGPPVRVVELDVRSAYLYEFANSKTTGLVLFLVNFVNSDARYDRVWLFFDSRDVLTHSGTQLSAHRARFAMPWSRIHDADKNAQMDAKYAEQQAKAQAKMEAEAEAAKAKSSDRNEATAEPSAAGG